MWNHVFFYFLIICNLTKTKDSSDYVEVVPNNTISVFVEWGRLSDTGISKNTIDNYLSGQKSIPNAENAVKIAKYLGTTVEYLVTGTILDNLQSQDISKTIKNLYRLNKTDLEAVKTIISSLAQK